MSKIHLLDKSVAELIAAGEVVERPASIVKELVENSIDAGSSVITIEIKNGGNSFIRVTDDGCGIEYQDVKTAFLRHATSKVFSASDLDGIATLGFRGEALASICAVSKVEMFTRTPNHEFGTHIVLNGSDIISLDESGCPFGTTFIVRDIFFNTPARIKFLKKDVSEGNAVANIIDKLALSHPEISFKFIRDQKIELHTPGNGDLVSCAYAVLGKQFAEDVLEVDYADKGITITGLVCKPESSKANRTFQNFFINNRFIKSKTCMAALEEAYKGSIMVGKFPSCVLKLQIEPNFVDVNVHPAKIEVRFADERPIFNSVYWAVKNTLQNYSGTKNVTLESTPKPAVNPFTLHDKSSVSQLKINEPQRMSVESYKKLIMDEEPKQKNDLQQQIFKSSQVVYQTDKAKTFNINLHTSQNEPVKSISKLSNPNDMMNQKKEEEKPCIDQLNKTIVEEPKSLSDEVIPINQETEKSNDNSNDNFDYIYIGECFSTYIIFQYGSELVFVDKHAAHERLIYEKLKSSDYSSMRQVLLSPVVISLSKQDYDVALNHLEELTKCGFLVEDFGNSTIIIREIPVVIQNQNITEIVMDIVEKIGNNNINIMADIIDDLLHSIACRSAIKSNDKSNDLELKELLHMLKQDQNIKHCPHGRPIKIAVSKKELEKQFGRI